jgi:hypothetical protein
LYLLNFFVPVDFAGLQMVQRWWRVRASCPFIADYLT